MLGLISPKGIAEGAIIVTAGAWPAQLGGNGRLVVSLRTRGMSRSWVLEHGTAAW